MRQLGVRPQRKYFVWYQMKCWTLPHLGLEIQWFLKNVSFVIRSNIPVRANFYHAKYFLKLYHYTVACLVRSPDHPFWMLYVFQTFLFFFLDRMSTWMFEIKVLAPKRDSQIFVLLNIGGEPSYCQLNCLHWWYTVLFSVHYKFNTKLFVIL